MWQLSFEPPSSWDFKVSVFTFLTFLNLLLLALRDAGLLEESAATQLFQHASALELLLKALQRAVNGFVVFDLNDNHIER